jgi:hypothetical protein
MVHGTNDGHTVIPSNDIVAHVKSRALVKIKPPNSYRTSLIFVLETASLLVVYFLS